MHIATEASIAYFLLIDGPTGFPPLIPRQERSSGGHRESVSYPTEVIANLRYPASIYRGTDSRSSLLRNSR
jgi:hypothetical protein